MKHLCCSRFILVLIFLGSSLFAALTDKSAIAYYGKNISYPMVGIHDYIIVNPDDINVYTHGFDVYKNKIYADVTVTKNLNDLTEILKKKVNDGYENFFINFKNLHIDDKSAINIIKSLKESYPQSKIMISAKVEVLDALQNFIDVILLESYLNGDVSKFLSYGLDVIDIEYLNISDKKNVTEVINRVKLNGMIPYVSNHDLDIYGVSSKNAIKREVFTLIDESIDDRVVISAHQYGAMPLEYMGYIQKLYEINDGLPDMEEMKHYAGVVIWLNVDYAHPQKLIKWVLSLEKIGVKVAFADNFGSGIDDVLLNRLSIKVSDGSADGKQIKKITYRDDMIGFEIEPALSGDYLYLDPLNAKALLTYEDENGLSSTPSAITSWGGYAIAESFMMELSDENIWIIDPFKYFAESLRLLDIPVPDPTTENGNRLHFTHIDGDGIMNYVESNPELFSGDMILDKILKPYKIPHSVSLIGAEIYADGLYPEISEKLLAISKKMYELENVEGATHTFTHPFIWGKIKDGNLDEEFRLKVKDYKFNIYKELKGGLDYINANLQSKDKRAANSIFWSGDCAPEEEILDFVYRKNILNINGGDTTITKTNPYLTNVAPLGLERGEYYQIYTGAQNENVFTNDWLGPFWGFKKVVQTFKMTNSPRRLKPIDVYYHLYSGSKTASLNALKYIFDWSLKQDVMPIFTSEYIPKVMDYYTASMANDGDEWLVEGMKDLKTLRIEKENASIDLNSSKSTLGIKHFENHTYLSLNNETQHFIKMTETETYKDETYLISSNAKVAQYKYGISSKQYIFDGYVDLKVNLNIAKGCKIESTPKATKTTKENSSIELYYKNHKKAVVNVLCR